MMALVHNIGIEQVLRDLADEIEADFKRLCQVAGPQVYDCPSRFSGDQIRGMVGPKAECVRPRMTV